MALAMFCKRRMFVPFLGEIHLDVLRILLVIS